LFQQPDPPIGDIIPGVDDSNSLPADGFGDDSVSSSRKPKIVPDRMDRSIDRRTRALIAHDALPIQFLSVSTNKLTVNSCRSARPETAPQQLPSTRRFDHTVIKPAS
jgi:hypothetical protein